VVILTTAAGPTVNNQNRNAFRVAAFFHIKLMGWVHGNTVLSVRLEFGIESKHGLLRLRHYKQSS
jgi:hypothetical protein